MSHSVTPPEPIVITGDRRRLVTFIVLVCSLLIFGGVASWYILRTEDTRGVVEKEVKPNLCQEGNDASCVRLLNRLCREEHSCRSFLDRLIAVATPHQKRQILRVLPSLRRQLRAELRGQGDASPPGSRQRRGPDGRVLPQPDGVPQDDDLGGSPDNGGGGGGGSSPTVPQVPQVPQTPQVPNTPSVPNVPNVPDLPQNPVSPLLPSLPDVLGGVGGVVDKVLPDQVCVLAACPTPAAP